MNANVAAAMLLDTRREVQKMQMTEIDCRLADIRRADPDEQAELWASLLTEYAERTMHPTVKDILEGAAKDMAVIVPELKEERANEEANYHDEMRRKRG